VEIEALKDCPITVTGLAHARNGKRSAMLIPAGTILEAKDGAECNDWSK
jgi:hypothetical protein